MRLAGYDFSLPLIVCFSSSVHVHHINVTVEVDKQKHLWDPLPNFPVWALNTDGCDISGRNITVEDSFIQNFDDAVAVKVETWIFLFSSS